MQRIAPCLWFDSQAEEAVNFYLSIFKNSKILTITRYGKSGPRPAGSVLTIKFQLDGQEFIALNGGPEFQFTEAVSMTVNCTTQEEIDMYWEKLSEGGQESRCGWLKDKFGLSWQIVPANISELLTDSERSERVMNAILQMDKLDIRALQQAYEA